MSEDEEARRGAQPPPPPPPPPSFEPPPPPRYEPPPQYQPLPPPGNAPPAGGQPPAGYPPAYSPAPGAAPPDTGQAPPPGYPVQPPGYPPPQGYPPPPPGYPAPGRPPTPFDYPQQPGAPPRPARRGFLGALVSAALAVWAFIKYGGLLLLKFGAVKTLLTLLLSLGLWALLLGPWAGLGIVIMILVHELGHYAEIRRQGGTGAGIVFVPFFGAATYQRSRPADALKQAEIAIAGPVTGTVAATVAFVLYGLTHSPVLLYWAYIGFFINLINLIPAGFLDGGQILGAVSKWFQVVGVVGILVAVFAIGVSPLLLFIGLLGIPSVIERFRNDRADYYQSVPVAARWAIGASWLVLVAYLGFAVAQTSDILRLILQQ
jgi:Zn-dependent protease